MTEQQEFNYPAVAPIETVLKEWTDHWQFRGSPREQEQLADLRVRLIARDETLADTLRVAGDQFHLMPQFVAKVLMDVGVGEPPTDERRTYVNQQFADLLQHMRDEHGYP